MSTNQYHSVERSVEEDLGQNEQFYFFKSHYFDAQIKSDGYQKEEKRHIVLI